MLVEHETLKMKQYDDEYASEMKNWNAQLKPRKQVSFVYVLFLFNILSFN